MEADAPTDEPASSADAAEKSPVTALLELLRKKNPGRVIDIFRKMDDDLSGTIDKKEWRFGVATLLGKEKEVPSHELVDALFDQIDRNGSGELELKELDGVFRLGLVHGIQLDKKLQVGGAGEIVLSAKTLHAARTADDLGPKATLKVDLAASADMAPDEALRAALNANAVRVIDLFRDWDVNEDGMIGRSEFVRGVTLLGLPGGEESAKELFDSWDVDESGALEIRELNRMLRRGQELQGAASMAKRRLFQGLSMYRNAYVVNMHPRRNWSHRKVDGASDLVVHVPDQAKALLKGALKSAPPVRDEQTRQQWREATVMRPGTAKGSTSPPISSPRLAEELRARSARAGGGGPASRPLSARPGAVVSARSTAAHTNHIDAVKRSHQEKADMMLRREAQRRDLQRPFVVRLFESPLSAGDGEQPPFALRLRPTTPRRTQTPGTPASDKPSSARPRSALKREVVELDVNALEDAGQRIVQKAAAKASLIGVQFEPLS